MARMAADNNCDDITVIDVRTRSQVCDFVVIASGTSARQMKSVAGEMDKQATAEGNPAWRRSADDGTSWIVVDFVETIVHLFEPSQRAYYDLEGLWKEAPRVEWRPKAKSKTKSK